MLAKSGRLLVTNRVCYSWRNGFKEMMEDNNIREIGTGTVGSQARAE